MEKIRQAVTEIWVPQVWQPPARPPARTVTTIPLQPEGLRGKNLNVSRLALQSSLPQSIEARCQVKYESAPTTSE